MKKVSGIAVLVSLITGVVLGINWHKIPIQLVAQESSPVKKSIHLDESISKQSKSSAEQTAPAFFINDVIETLTTAAGKLIEQKLTRNSEDLRKGLERTEVSIRLPNSAIKPLTSQELYLRAAESVFLVAGLTKPSEEESEWQTAFSTAFAIHEDGVLSTSAHVFDHEDHDDAVVVMDIRGRVYPVVEILASDRKGDTCLFRVDTKGLKPLPLGSTAVPGTPIHVMGHPGDSFFYFSAGHIANYERDQDAVLWLNVTADFGQGSSGGPVMDGAGNIVGQVSRTYTLYAGGEASNRHRRPVKVRQVDDATPASPSEKSADEEHATRQRPDPQMVFKSCTPVTAIRALVKQ